MRVRALTAAGDMQFGRGQANFLKDVPEAPAQCVGTRLKEYVGDWFLDTSAGMAWRTKVLGFRTDDVRDAVVRARILGTRGVVSVDTYASQLDRNLRNFGVQALITTLYSDPTTGGNTAIINQDVRYAR